MVVKGLEWMSELDSALDGKKGHSKRSKSEHGGSHFRQKCFMDVGRWQKLVRTKAQPPFSKFVYP